MIEPTTTTVATEAAAVIPAPVLIGMGVIVVGAGGLLLWGRSKRLKAERENYWMREQLISMGQVPITDPKPVAAPVAAAPVAAPVAAAPVAAAPATTAPATTS